MTARVCAYCGDPLKDPAPAFQKFCSARCRMAFKRAKDRGILKRGESNAGAVLIRDCTPKPPPAPLPKLLADLTIDELVNWALQQETLPAAIRNTLVQAKLDGRLEHTKRVDQPPVDVTADDIERRLLDSRAGADFADWLARESQKIRPRAVEP